MVLVVMNPPANAGDARDGGGGGAGVQSLSWEDPME